MVLLDQLDPESLTAQSPTSYFGWVVLGAILLVWTVMTVSALWCFLKVPVQLPAETSPSRPIAGLFLWILLLVPIGDARDKLSGRIQLKELMAATTLWVLFLIVVYLFVATRVSSDLFYWLVALAAIVALPPVTTLICRRRAIGGTTDAALSGHLGVTHIYHALWFKTCSLIVCIAMQLTCAVAVALGVVRLAIAVPHGRLYGLIPAAACAVVLVYILYLEWKRALSTLARARRYTGPRHRRAAMLVGRLWPGAGLVYAALVFSNWELWFKAGGHSFEAIDVTSFALLVVLCFLPRMVRRSAVMSNLHFQRASFLRLI